jgi:hypothetical protein
MTKLDYLMQRWHEAKALRDRKANRDLRCIRHSCQYVQGEARLPPPMLRS